jgi:hypothetical protein
MPDARPCPAVPSRCRCSGRGSLVLLHATDLPLSADLMIRHQIGEVAPELDHLRADAVGGGTTSSRKYSISDSTGQRSGYAQRPDLATADTQGSAATAMLRHATLHLSGEDGNARKPLSWGILRSLGVNRLAD